MRAKRSMNVLVKVLCLVVPQHTLMMILARKKSYLSWPDQDFLFSGCYLLNDPNDDYDHADINDMTDEQKGQRYIETNALVHFDQDNIDAHLDVNNRLEKWVSKQSNVTGKQFTLRRKSTSAHSLKLVKPIKSL